MLLLLEIMNVHRIHYGLSNISQNGDSQTTETNSSLYWRESESPRSDVVRLGVFLRDQVLTYGMLCPHMLGVNKTVL